MHEQMQRQFEAAKIWYSATRMQLNRLPDPAHRALIQAQHVLDVGCGCGLWMIEQAKARLFCDFFGLDINPYQIELAGRLAEAERTRNAMFFVGDMNTITSPHFPDNAFGFIHVSNIAEALLKTDYQALAKRLYQLALPGGYIAWTEGEFPTTTSQALDQLTFHLCAALDAVGHSFSQEPPTVCRLYRRSLQITYWLTYWLTEARWCQIDELHLVFNLSARQPLHQPFTQILTATLPRLQAFLVHVGTLKERDAERLCERALLEVGRPDFSGLLHATTVIARKPDPNQTPPAPSAQAAASVPITQRAPEEAPL
jgi:ubiquinone/menaquinone biosynthesis C-methylase UbiE